MGGDSCSCLLEELLHLLIFFVGCRDKLFFGFLALGYCISSLCLGIARNVDESIMPTSESMPMDDIDALSSTVGAQYLHGGLEQPLNGKALRDANHMTVNNAGGWSINNNMNQVTASSSLPPSRAHTPSCLSLSPMPAV